MAAAHPFIEIAHLVSRQEQPVPLATRAASDILIDHDVQNVPLDTVAKDSDVIFLSAATHGLARYCEAALR